MNHDTKVYYSNYLGYLLQYLETRDVSWQEAVAGCSFVEQLQTEHLAPVDSEKNLGNHHSPFSSVDVQGFRDNSQGVFALSCDAFVGRLPAAIGENDLERILFNASEVLKIPVFQIGLEHGIAMSITSHGPLGLAGICSENAREAIATCSAYFRLLSPVYQINCYDEGAWAVTELLPSKALRPPVSSFLLAFGIACLYKSAYHLFGDAIFSFEERFVLEVSSELECEESFWAFYQNFFKLKFGCPITRFLMPESIANKQLSTANELTKKSVLSVCDAELGQTEIDFITSVTQAMVINQDRSSNPLTLEQLTVPMEFRTLDETAHELCMSSRTLHRNLQEQGTSFSRLLQALKMERAKKLLLIQKKSIKEVALLLGYTEVTNFSSAFKKFYGDRPKAYRQKHLREA